MVIECDVLVVGAGPAGTVAALRCAKHGLDTVLLEKNSSVGGQTKTKLDASADSELPNIIDDMSLKIENKVFNSNWHPPSGNYFQLKSHSPEYFFKRGPVEDSFETCTTYQAVDAGVQIHFDTKIERIKEVKGRLDFIDAKSGGNKIRIKPKIMVAADGANSLFHRFVYKRSENRKKIGYGVTGENFSDTDSSNIYFDAELFPGGYFYLITGQSGTSSACIVLDSLNMKKSSKDYYNGFLLANEALRDKIKDGATYFGGEVPIFDLDRCVHENLVFVGDAAGHMDPFFGYGMSSAIVGGYYAGNSIKKALDEDFSFLQEYDNFIREKFDKRLSYLYQRVFESLNNDDLDLIAEIISELDKKTDIDVIIRQLSGKSIN